VEYSGEARLCGCGNHGCLEQYASASGVAQSYKLATGIDLDAVRIANMARAGDTYALAAYSTAGAHLAFAIALISKILDVGQVVIGGGLCNAWDLLQEAFHAQLKNSLIPILRENLSVRISTSRDEAGIIGAALLAADL
jgi:glucokinase